MDIEDLANSSNPQIKNIEKIEKIEKKHKKHKNESSDEDDTGNDGDNIIHENIPGKGKVHIKTYGCSHNTSDTEYMMGLLYDYGYDIVDDVKKSDITIVNSCTVKGPSQEAFINYVLKSKDYGKPVIVCGCVPQADRNLKGLENCSVVGVSQIDRIVEVVEETLKGNIVRLLSKNKLPSLDLPKIRRNKYIEIIPINQGCLGSCTYCKTKQSRGKLTSYEPNAIINACKKAWNTGAKEIWITSEDTGVYGRDIGTNLPDLMIKILKDIPNDVMIRIGMGNPPYIMEHAEKMSKVLNHPNVYSFTHIPVQSGSNNTLDKMLREYKIEEFEYLCDYFIKNVPNITIATDFICGFPSESKDDFNETMELVEKYKFPVIYINQFYPRPGTVAAKMKKIDTKEVHKRSKALANLFHSYTSYDYLLNTEQRVWLHDDKIEEKNKKDNLMVGHTKSYVKVLIPFDESLLGKEIKVKIVKVLKWHVVGEIIDKNPQPDKIDYDEYFKGMLEDDEEKIKFGIKQSELNKLKIDIHSTFDMEIIENNNKENGNKFLMVFFYILGVICLFFGFRK